jgi:transposase InsO family protein
MSRYGIPDTLVTDYGPQFDSNEFKQFQKKWSFQHITSSPCYPQSNGGVERAVQSAKTLMKKAEEAGEDCYLSLLNQRNTPRDDVL